MNTQQSTAGAATPTVRAENSALVDAFISPGIIAPKISGVNRKAAAREVLATLWRDGRSAYYWTPDGAEYTDPATGETKRRKESLWFSPTRPLALPTEWHDRNVYFGVHPTSQQRQPWQRSKTESIAVVNCLFAEFDVKDFGSKDAIMAHLDQLWAYPTSIVDSGGGLHCYWILSRTVGVNDSNRREMAFLQSAWVELVGSDRAAKDLARVLRLPGTVNFKPQYGPDYPRVTLIEYSPMRRWDLPQVQMLASDHLAQLKCEYDRRSTEDASRTADVAPGAAHTLLHWAVANARPGNRHDLALWLCGRLKDEGIEPWVADAVLREYMRRVGDNPERDQKQAGAIVAHIFRGA